MQPHSEPAHGRPTFYRVIALVTWALLALSALLMTLVTRWGIWFSHEVTCQPPAPVAYRQHMVFTALGVYLVLVVPAVALLIHKSALGTVSAAVLVCVSFVVPVLAFLIPTFSAALC